MDIMKIFTILLIITIVILIFNLIKVDTNKNIEGFYQYNDKCSMINDEDSCGQEKDSTCKWKEWSCERKINCYDITDVNECNEDPTQGKDCIWEEKDDTYTSYIDGCNQFKTDTDTCEKNQEPRFKDKCKWNIDEFSNEGVCITKDSDCWNFDSSNKPPNNSTCVKRIEYDDKCESIREKTNCDNYTNAEGVNICKYQSDESGIGMYSMGAGMGGARCIGLDESEKQCSAATTEDVCAAKNCKWDKWSNICRNYECWDYSESGITPPEGSSCEENIGNCKNKGEDNCWDHDITTSEGNQACIDETHCEIGGECYDTKNCFTDERKVDKDACEKDSNKCKWVEEEGNKYCEDGASCGSSVKAESQDKCEEGGNCKWNQTNCINICADTKNKDTCDGITNCEWYNYEQKLYVNACYSLNDEDSCNTNNKCNWKDFSCNSKYPNQKACNNYKQDETIDEDSSCVLREGECTNQEGKDCYNLDPDKCEVAENQGACKLDAWCGEANEQIFYPDGYLNSLDTSESSCNSVTRNESEANCEADVEEGKPECKWNQTNCIDDYNCYENHTEEADCNNQNPFCKWDNGMCTNISHCYNITDMAECGKGDSAGKCKPDGWCSTETLDTSFGIGSVGGAPGMTTSTGMPTGQGQGQTTPGMTTSTGMPTGQGQGQGQVLKGALNNLSERLNNQLSELKRLQSNLPNDIGTLLDKEEYLLRSLDSMGEKSGLKADNENENVNVDCQEKLTDGKCPTKLVSRYNRIKLHLNYVLTPDSEYNTCIVTINLNYKCGSKNESQCNTDCEWDPEKRICSTVNNTDSIQKLIVKEVTENNKQTLKLESGSDGCVDDNYSCSHFKLRKICNKKQYIDLYDQYTTKYFVADPNVDYNDMYLLQPLYHPEYTLQLKTDSGSETLILNELSGNKNEQFEKIY